VAGMSISGLSSGLDTTTIVSQLMQLEAQPQTALESRLTDTKADASAYRTVNSVFTTLRSAAEALTKATAWTPAKATSSVTSVSASTTAGAAAGSVTFTVGTLAARHSVITSTAWTAPTADTTLTVAGTPVALKAGATVQDAIAAITASGAKVTASAVNDGTGSRLQMTATKDGLAGVFGVSGGQEVKVLAQGVDARLTVGPGSPAEFTVTSPTNTFTGVLAGTTFTVGEAGARATVTVASDPAAVTSAVQALVTAANSALSTIREYSANGPGSTAVLRGDSSLRALAGQVAQAVSAAVGQALPPLEGGSVARDGSPALAGIELTRDGTITFDAAAFSATLKDDPALVKRLVDGSGAVPGVAQRLLTLARTTTDATTGTLTNLAKGKDTEATDIQKRIEAWDLRLELRQQTLTRQFTAMESALSSLQSQSSWLSSQLANLPSWSSSS
jgi:flagellar hook-associated protein 2